MSLSTEIDRLLRHSLLARAQPFIRGRLPWLHRVLLSARDAVLPFRSEHGLARYQHRDIERFFSFSPDLSGPVLEVGSDVDGRVLRELTSRGVTRLVGTNIEIDPQAHVDRGLNGGSSYSIINGDVRCLPFKDAAFSAILSITAFEHINNFDVALREMHRVLRPGGLLYADFGPIWSCSIGHHVFAIVDGVEARHWKPGKNPVPHFAHLLTSREQVREAVLQKDWVFPKLADAIVHYIYDGDAVNRIFYEDYVKYFHESPFMLRHLAPVREHVSANVQRKLEERCPGYRDFSVRMVEIVLQKRP
jgi:SAM-dependent methyltransferase